MVMAIVVPEVVTASAFAQRVSARESVKAMDAIGCTWSMRQAFYLNMGGVWLHPKDGNAFPINAAQLNCLIYEGIMKSPSLSGKEIWDKSKSDKLAKILACLQIGWLSLQCVGRAAQHLPISLLEIGTVGFAIPSLATFIFWFSKPHDIETPTILPLDMSVEELLKRLAPPSGYTWLDTPLDYIDRLNAPSFVSEIILKAPHRPMRTGFAGPATRIRNDVFALKYSKLDQVVVFACWAGYAGVHLCAWSFVFPSHVECILWRTSSLVMAGSMAVFWVTANRRFYGLLSYIWPSRKSKMQKIVCERRRVSPTQIFLGALTACSYLVARMCLIVQVLVSLRALPIGAFETVNWSNFIPHE